MVVYCTDVLSTKFGKAIWFILWNIFCKKTNPQWHSLIGGGIYIS